MFSRVVRRFGVNSRFQRCLSTNGLVMPETLSSKLAIRPGGRSSVSGIVATVFGATGFVGRYVVEKLAQIGSQVIVPYRGDGMDVRHLKVMGDNGQVVPVPCSIYNEQDVARVVSRSNVVVNLLGSMHETTKFKYHDVHVKASYRIAKAAQEAGVKHFVQMSTVGAHPQHESKWVATKAEAEDVVRSFFPESTILRSCTIYGEEDRFLNRYAAIASFLPVVPLVDNGLQKLQPIYVEDVAHAVLNSIILPEAHGQIFHLGGDEILTLHQFVEFIMKEIVRPSNTSVLPYWAAKLYGRAIELAPARFRLLNSDLVTQMKYDFIVPQQPGIKTLQDLGLTPSSLENTAPRFLVRHRRDRIPEHTSPRPLEINL